MRDAAAIRAALEELNLIGVAQAIAGRYHVTVDEMLSDSREEPRPRARQALWLELYHRGWSLPRIGRVIGRDHTTVLTGIRKVRQAMLDLGFCVRCAGAGTIWGSDNKCDLCSGTGQETKGRKTRRSA